MTGALGKAERANRALITGTSMSGMPNMVGDLRSSF